MPTSRTRVRSTTIRAAKGRPQPRSSFPPLSDAEPHRPSATEQAQAILASLERSGSERFRREISVRFGIVGPTAETAFGVPMSKLQRLARDIIRRQGRSHDLAAELWRTGRYEARMLSSLIDEPARVSSEQMDRWAADFDKWAICDTACFHLFDRVPSALAFRKVRQWSRSQDEFVKRAGFALLASLAGHDKAAGDGPFLKCLPLVEQGVSRPPDDRNFVKKGVSWALRRIGRRSAALHAAAVATAQRLAASPHAGARWVGKDALRDLGRVRSGR